MSCFELGPIRPPSEAQSILLRLTRNCHWNKCAFCPVYKNTKFSMRTVDEIKRDIDTMARITHMLSCALKDQYPDRNDDTLVARLVKNAAFDADIDEGCARQVAFWMYHGMKSMFLQDADALAHRTENLIDILNYARNKFPTIERITTYSRAKTVSRKSLDELKTLRKAGLNRIHIGMESGSDAVLALVNKGVTQEEQIVAGHNVMTAGFELSEYFMPGLGGKDLSLEHAHESAAALNAVNPTFIRLRSTIPVPGTPLYELMQNGEWTPLGEEDKVGEIRLFIEHLQGISSTIQSDHIMNLLEDVEGVLPKDKTAMLGTIDTFLNMQLSDKESFIVGRRIGRYRRLSNYVPLSEVEGIKQELKSRFGSIDEGIMQILVNYI